MGKLVHKEPVLYKDSEKITIIVTKYDDGKVYATQIRTKGAESKKVRLYKGRSQKQALASCKDAVQNLQLNDWKHSDPIFGAIQEKNREESIIEFLGKYGSDTCN